MSKSLPDLFDRITSTPEAVRLNVSREQAEVVLAALPTLGELVKVSAMMTALAVCEVPIDTAMEVLRLARETTHAP